MQVYVASSYRTSEDRERIERAKDILKKLNLDFFTAKDEEGIGYGKEKKVRKEIFHREKKELLNADLLVAILARATLGTSMEIQLAADNNIPVVALVLSDDPDLVENAWLENQAEVVKSWKELEDYLNEMH